MAAEPDDAAPEDAAAPPEGAAPLEEADAPPEEAAAAPPEDGAAAAGDGAAAAALELLDELELDDVGPELVELHAATRVVARVTTAIAVNLRGLTRVLFMPVPF